MPVLYTKSLSRLLRPLVLQTLGHLRLLRSSLGPLAPLGSLSARSAFLLVKLTS